MKKFLSITMMMATMMAVAFSFSSCGSDDDDNFQSYKLDVSLKIDQAGKMTSEECQAMIMQAAQQSTVANYPSDNAAEIGARMTASELAEGLKKEAAKFGDAVFTFTLKVTNNNTGSQVITYYVTFNKGDVSYYNNINSK